MIGSEPAVDVPEMHSMQGGALGLPCGALTEMFSAGTGMGIPRVSFPKELRGNSLRLSGQKHCSGTLC